METSAVSLFETHRARFERAREACRTRECWSPFPELPNKYPHADCAQAAGKQAFEAHLNRAFVLDQPGEIGRLGEEISPYTQAPLGISYPRADLDCLFSAARSAMDAGWAQAEPELRIGIFLEVIERLFGRMFEITFSVMHAARQSYNMSYAGSGVNALLMQSVLPVLVLIWAFALYGERPGIAQSVGVAISLVGVATIVSGGSLDALLHLSLNRGDTWILVALALNAVYGPLLRHRPEVHPLSFIVTAMGLASLLMLPFYLFEVSQGATIRGGWPSYAAMAYAAVLPSFVAYFFYTRSIELIGAARAGQSAHMMPVFGSILAVLFLGERFYAYHVAGIALIATGILLASRKPRAAD